ncbi:MAG: fused MFS/spermidine synthase [Cardiobacteriaceae bacterium]|nr:fused MFS/spermidine synthase [Cardiobacteriaceae bacterium]
MAYKVNQAQNAQLNKALSISEVGGIRYLHLGSINIQSAMNVSRPSELVLAYTQAMMAWLLFHDDVVRITQIGLGGGSLSRWLRVHLPDAKQTVVELNPYVVAMAKAHFKLPEANSNFQVIEADGLVYAHEHPNSCEILLVDAYEAEGIDAGFLSEDFFRAAYAMLEKQGIFVANWWSKDKRFEEAYARLSEVFAGKVLQLSVQDKSNVIVFGFKESLAYSRFEAIKQRIPRLTERFELDFNRYFAKLRAQNPHGEQGFRF